MKQGGVASEEEWERCEKARRRYEQEGEGGQKTG